MAEMTLQQAYELAVQRYREGRLGEAESLCRQILAYQPGCHPASRLLAAIVFRAGCDLRSAQRLDEAAAAFRQAVSLWPQFAEGYVNLGAVLDQQGRRELAIAAYHQALALRPDLPEAHNSLGLALVGLGRWEEAIPAYRRALELRPDYAAAWHYLGEALCEAGRPDEGAEAMRRAIALAPDVADAYTNLGLALSQLGDYDGVDAAYRKALSLQPDDAIARYGSALNLLRRGDFARGWALHEARFDFPEVAPPGWCVRPFPTRPAWDGSNLAGRRILLRYEQGLGDTLQFIRYAPLVAARGGDVVVLCQPPLTRLLRGQGHLGEVIDNPGEGVRFDTDCSIMSLPYLFGTTLQTVPADVPYLRADPGLAAAWAARLTAESEPDGASPPARLRVGLVWAGSPGNRVDRRRSLELSALAPLAGVPGVRFYSLQKGPQAAQAKSPPPGMDLVDWTDELNDFADTTALVANQDLVITVDTSMAHLAGAMAKPVWVLLPFAPDFRWMLGRSDSPWYPTMRLFRQPAFGDWATPLKQAAQALAVFVSGSATGQR